MLRRLLGRESGSGDGSAGGVSVEGMRKSLLPAQARMMSLCAKNEHMPSRWLGAASLAALEEEGSYEAHRLRAAHLCEAGFSLLLAAKWRRLMRHMVGNDLLHGNQYGGAPGRGSAAPALAQQMQREATRATRKSLIPTGYDATSC